MSKYNTNLKMDFWLGREEYEKYQCESGKTN
jgi:hypothetical protein